MIYQSNSNNMQIPIEAIKRQLPQANDGYSMTTLAYIPPEEQLRRAANKIEQDREDRRVIQEWLDYEEERRIPSE